MCRLQYLTGLTTQIRNRSRATQQGRVKCRSHVTIPAVPTQEAIPEEGGKKSTKSLMVTVIQAVVLVITYKIYI